MLKIKKAGAEISLLLNKNVISKLYILMIKDMNLIADMQPGNNLNTTIFTLKNIKLNNNKTKLGDVFNYLPHGIIDKTETGIGGTSLELDSNRNSIVVQPFNNIAYSKSQLKSFTNAYDVLFFSSNSYYDSKKKTSNKLTTKSLDPISRLKEYMSHCDKMGQPIKIVCIINQLEQLYECLKTLKKDPAGSFHLVLDEIDTLQEHSSFRNEAAKCFNIYKNHSPDMRIMISATLMKFHDKDLKNEPVTIVKYKKTIKPLIGITNTRNIKEEAVRAILKLVLLPKTKIVISCNSFSYSRDIIRALEKDLNFKKSIKILCSNTSKSKNQADKYYGEMLPNGILPADINFITAAYFSGHDINERYHNIILAEKLSPSLRLSPRLIYQITGRCRDDKGLYSNHLIISFNSNKPIKYNLYTAKELIDNVNDQKAIFEFTSKIKQSSNKYMKGIIESMENVFYEGTEDIPSVYDKDSSGLPVISYFKVDSRIEEQNTFNLYSSLKKFKTQLDKKFQATLYKAAYQTDSAKLIEKKDPKIAASSLLKELIKLDRDLDYATNLRMIELGISIPIHSVEKAMLSIYKNALSNDAVDLTKLSSALQQIIDDKQIKARIEELDFYLNFNKYVLTDELFMQNIAKDFPINETISVGSANRKIEVIIKTFKKLSKTKSPNIKKLINNLEKKPLLFRKTLLQTQDKNSKIEKQFIVLGYDKFQVLGD